MRKETEMPNMGFYSVNIPGMDAGLHIQNYSTWKASSLRLTSVLLNVSCNLYFWSVSRNPSLASSFTYHMTLRFQLSDR